MKKWEKLDEESGINFAVEVNEQGKYVLNCTYNKIRINIRDYVFDEKGLKVFKEVLNMVSVEKPKRKK